MLVVIDTLARTMIGDENKARDVTDFVTPINQLMSDYNTTVVVVHHLNKHGDGRTGKRLRGSSALWGACDAVLGFDRATDGGAPTAGGKIDVETKDGEPVLLRFEFDQERLLLESAQILHATSESIAEHVSRIWDDTGEGARFETLHIIFKGGKSWFHERLNAAIASGAIRKEGKGKATRYLPAGQTLGLEGG